MKKYCACCARQLSCKPRNSQLQAPPPFIKGFGDELICGDCAQDLDENGNFYTEYQGEFYEDECKCPMKTKLVGDGCHICNSKYKD